MIPRLLTLLLFCLSLAALPARAAFETQAEAAYVIDMTTGTVLLDKNGEMPLPPASMSKLMTLLMLFEAVRDNPTVNLETEFNVSSKARAMGGSTMFLNERDKPTAEDLIKGIIVQSGNDATVVVAEGLAGTEDAFARMMNARAREMGMAQSTFVNASGWPSPNHLMSMKDLVILAETLIRDFPEYYGWFALEEWEYDDRAPKNRFNRNPILNLGIGADGLKTGHTQEAGFSLVGSARQGNRRIVFAITGLDSRETRREEAESIINWGFRQ
ncbi:MAG: D-alanyl-D-alanine carboxypeptidase family protein, partial [Pseudomonadota bacterium]